MDARLRDRLAIGIATLAVFAAVGTMMFGAFDSGIRLAEQGDHVVIADVNDHSLAHAFGLTRGMIVTRLNGVALLRLPAFVYPTIPPTPDPNGEEPAPQPIAVEPPEPTVVDIRPDVLAALLASPIQDLEAIEPWALEQGSAANGWSTTQISDDGRSGLRRSMPSVFLGAAILFVAGWWLASGRAGAGLKPLAVPLAVATATPFILRPLEATWSPPIVALSGVLLALAMVPLAIGLLENVADLHERRLVAQATAACAIGAILVGIALAVTEPWSGSGVARWALVGAIPLIPGPLPRVPSSRVAFLAPHRPAGASSNPPNSRSRARRPSWRCPPTRARTSSRSRCGSVWSSWPAGSRSGRSRGSRRARNSSAISWSQRRRRNGRASRRTSTTTRSRN